MEKKNWVCKNAKCTDSGKVDQVPVPNDEIDKGKGLMVVSGTKQGITSENLVTHIEESEDHV